jgi:hypothetical protein
MVSGREYGTQWRVLQGNATVTTHGFGGLYYHECNFDAAAGFPAPRLFFSYQRAYGAQDVGLPVADSRALLIVC